MIKTRINPDAFRALGGLYLVEANERRVAEAKAEAARIAKENRQQASWIELNNLYLKVERHEVRLTIHIANKLRCLASDAYDQTDPLRDWWAGEFVKLPNWNNV